MSSSILDDYPEGSIRDAIKEYEARTLIPATQAREVDVYAPEGILTELGPVHAITYTGTLQGDTELYEHTFRGDAQPDLMVDAKNTLHLVGGNYHVADVGIVDGEGPMLRRNPEAPRRNPIGEGVTFNAYEIEFHEGTDALGGERYRTEDELMQALIWIAAVHGDKPGYSKTYVRPIEAPARSHMNERLLAIATGPQYRFDLYGDADMSRVRDVVRSMIGYSDDPAREHVPIESLHTEDDRPSPERLSESDKNFIMIALRRLEQDPDIHEEERLNARRIKGYFQRFKNPTARTINPVVTNRVSPSSPVENAGVLAMAMPGGSPYGLPQVNAGALAAGPNYPSNYDFPGVTNGSNGLLGPQIKRNVPGQPIANPVTKADGRWHRAQNQDVGIHYTLNAGDVASAIYRYQPRKHPATTALASRYETEHKQDLPKGTQWLTLTVLVDDRPKSVWAQTITSAHKTLKAAKRAAEKNMKQMREQ